MNKPLSLSAVAFALTLGLSAGARAQSAAAPAAAPSTAPAKAASNFFRRIARLTLMADTQHPNNVRTPIHPVERQIAAASTRNNQFTHAHFHWTADTRLMGQHLQCVENKADQIARKRVAGGLQKRFAALDIANCLNTEPDAPHLCAARRCRVARLWTRTFAPLVPPREILPDVGQVVLAPVLHHVVQRLLRIGDELLAQARTLGRFRKRLQHEAMRCLSAFRGEVVDLLF